MKKILTLFITLILTLTFPCTNNFVIADNIEDTIMVELSELTIYREDIITRLINGAREHTGKPYRAGGKGPNAFDCSGFTSYVFSEYAGIDLKRSAAEQSRNGRNVKRDSIKAGDLVFFASGKHVSHVGIITDVFEDGNAKFIHSSSSRGIMESELNDYYWNRKKFSFRRMV